MIRTIIDLYEADKDLEKCIKMNYQDIIHVMLRVAFLEVKVEELTERVEKLERVGNGTRQR